MNRQLRICLFSSDPRRTEQVQSLLVSEDFLVNCLPCHSSSLGLVYSDVPDLIIIDLAEWQEVCCSLIQNLRSDTLFNSVPIIAVVGDTTSVEYDWDSVLFDDFVRLPVDGRELLPRIQLCQSRMKRIFDNNPLTKLPGNTSIQRAIEDAMGKELAVCYADINNFKPYNDAYGFSNGDKVLRMLGRIIFNAVRDSGGGFCGHIGGDDYVFIIPIERADHVCQTVIEHFDHIVLDLFDDDVRQLGYYVGINRRYEEEKIPLLGVSIAVINMAAPRIEHSANVAEVAAELKKQAKQSGKSCYLIDRRWS